MSRIFGTLILLLTIGNLAVFAQQDSLVMKSKEVLFGEIKSFNEGVLIIETSYSDKDFNVEWDKIVSIKTEQKFLVLSSKGDRYFGRLVSTKEDPSLVMVMDEEAGNPVVKMDEIVFFKEIDETFWKRLELKLSAGYTLAKANDSHQFSANFEAGYLTNLFNYDIHFGAIRTIQTDEAITTKNSRTDGGFGIVYFIVNDWFAVVRSDLLQSSEQKLDLRATTKGGVGHYPIMTNKMNLGLATGIAWNYENYFDLEDLDRNSAEAFLAAEYKIFDMGDLDLHTSVIGYPSLTEKGRFRTDFNFSLEYEFSFDLFINLGFVLNYDNQPSAGATSTDYVMTTAIGWKL